MDYLLRINAHIASLISKKSMEKRKNNNPTRFSKINFKMNKKMLIKWQRTE